MQPSGISQLLVVKLLTQPELVTPVKNDFTLKSRRNARFFFYNFFSSKFCFLLKSLENIKLVFLFLCLLSKFNILIVEICFSVWGRRTNLFFLIQDKVSSLSFWITFYKNTETLFFAPKKSIPFQNFNLN